MRYRPGYVFAAIGIVGKLRKVSGESKGVLAERKVDAENGWLWDLWLCERLLAELDRG